MSKIFDALQRGQMSESDLILSSIRGMTGTASEPAIIPPLPGESLAESLRPAAAITEPIGEERSEPDYQTVTLSPAQPILSFSGEDELGAEQYRMARTKIVQHPARPQVLLVSSAAPGDGKTTMAINLAAALSLNSQGDVLLLDGDLRRGCIPSCLGLAGGPGIAEVLAGECSLREAIVRAGQLPSLCILRAGEVRENPAELLDSPQWQSLCARVRQNFRYVVIDSPPVSAVADYDLLQAAADGVVITVMPDHTPRTLLFDVIKKIPPEKLIGVILNRVRKWFLFKYPHENYYRYYSGRSSRTAHHPPPAAPPV